jgi:hypothetical protein
MSAPLRIRPPSQKGGGEQDVLKSYLDRLLKLIPAEVLSLYLVGKGVIPPTAVAGAAIWATFCLFCAGLVKAYGTADAARGVKPDWTHVFLSMTAFVIWVYSMGGNLSALWPYEPYLGSLFILGFTFIVPYVYHGQNDIAGT